MRVGHLSPDTPAVDVYVGAPGLDPTDEGTNPVVEDLSYPSFAPDSEGSYLELKAGTYDISVTPADSPGIEAIDINGFALDANRDYTVLAVGELDPEEDDEPAIQALPLVDNADDDTALPPADATLIRAVHASPDAGAVDVVVSVDGSEALRLEDVTFGDASAYLEAPENAEISVEKGGIEVLGPIENPLGNGEKGSAYVIGNVTPEEGGDGPLGAETDDAPLSAVTTLDATNPSRGRGGDEEAEEEEEEAEEEEEEGAGRERGRGRGA